MARIIGIDFGQKRTGIAVTDPLKIIVSPLISLSTISLKEYLIKYFKDESVEELVIGYPTHEDGTKTYLCAEIDIFLKELIIIFKDLKISKIDESFSSQEAYKLMADASLKKKNREKKGTLDMYSAVVILRRHLGY